MPAPTSRQARGRWAEDLARRHLEAHGLATVACNYRCRRGEIDLIMREGESLLFVEVRYRGRRDYGSGVESVDRRKQARIVAAAEQYLLEHPRLRTAPCRFDVLGVAGGREAAEVQWIKNAFQA